MDQSERRRYIELRNQRDKYRRLIEVGRDSLSEWHMEILFTLYEQPTKEQAADELNLTVEELNQELDIILEWREKNERHTKDGKSYKKRLSRTAFVGILAERDDLNEEEQAMLRAMIDAPNQVVAATSLGMSYSDFEKRFLKMRRDRDF